MVDNCVVHPVANVTELLKLESYLVDDMSDEDNVKMEIDACSFRATLTVSSDHYREQRDEDNV